MKLNKNGALLLSAFALLLTFTSANFAQMVGGYRVVAKTDAAAIAAANYAITAQSDKTDMDYELDEIIKAERQVVQGSNYRLCMEVNTGGDESFFVQAVVYVDLKAKYRLTSWAKSTCGDVAAAPAAPLTKPIMVGGYSLAPKTDALVVGAAKYAASAQSTKMDTEFSVNEIIKAERQVVAGMNYRICMRVDVEGDEPIMVSALVYQDLKRNYTLSAWTAGPCGK